MKKIVSFLVIFVGIQLNVYGGQGSSAFQPFLDESNQVITSLSKQIFVSRWLLEGDFKNLKNHLNDLIDTQQNKKYCVTFPIIIKKFQRKYTQKYQYHRRKIGASYRQIERKAEDLALTLDPGQLFKFKEKFEDIIDGFNSLDNSNTNLRRAISKYSNTLKSDLRDSCN